MRDETSYASELAILSFGLPVLNIGPAGMKILLLVKAFHADKVFTWVKANDRLNSSTCDLLSSYSSCVSAQTVTSDNNASVTCEAV